MSTIIAIISLYTKLITAILFTLAFHLGYWAPNAERKFKSLLLRFVTIDNEHEFFELYRNEYMLSKLRNLINFVSECFATYAKDIHFKSRIKRRANEQELERGITGREKKNLSTFSS